MGETQWNSETCLAQKNSGVAKLVSHKGNAEQALLLQKGVAKLVSRP